MASTALPAVDDHELLFGSLETRLGIADMAAITVAMGFTAVDGKLTYPGCGDMQPSVELVDLNDDGSYEVFISYGNACYSGMTGRHLILFVKDESGRYRSHLGFPAYSYHPIARGPREYPDLELTGPGFCFPLWSWGPSGYAFACNRPQAPDGCAGREHPCPN